MVWTHRVATAAIALLVTACAGAAPPPPTVAIESPTPSPTITKPTTTQEPLSPPTYVRWAVDKSGSPERPYFLDFFYDGVATNFRVIDGSGQVVLRVPISGSGVFGLETCVVRARPPGKVEGFTYLVIDAAALERFMRDSASYRVEADSVGGRTVTIPLADSGCRPL